MSIQHTPGFPDGIAPGNAVMVGELTIGRVASAEERLTPTDGFGVKHVDMKLEDDSAHYNVALLLDRRLTGLAAEAVIEQQGPNGELEIRIIGTRTARGTPNVTMRMHVDQGGYLRAGSPPPKPPKRTDHAALGVSDEDRRHLGDFSRALDEQIQVLHFVESPAGQDFLEKLGMGMGGSATEYRVRGYSEPWAQRSNPDWFDAMHYALRYGETFYVTPHISDFLAQTTANVPTATLRRELLPSPNGFCLFDKPLPMPVLNMDDGRVLNDDIAAIAWRSVRDQHEHLDLMPEVSREAAVFVCFARPTGGAFGPLRPVISFAWHFGRTQLDVATKHALVEAQLQGLDDPELEDMHEYWMKVRRLRTNHIIGLLSFLSQRILVPSRPVSASRSTRKRAESAGWKEEPVIRVVEYRRREYRSHSVPGDNNEPAREYHVRWIVGASTGGFWNHYHTRNGLEARWLLPFEKGPLDAPLQYTRARVNVVKR